MLEQAFSRLTVLQQSSRASSPSETSFARALPPDGLEHGLTKHLLR
jgi:hypothetical protein